MCMLAQEFAKLTPANLLEDGNELFVTLPKDLGQVDMLKIAFLILLVLLGCNCLTENFSYLPCLTLKSPFVCIWPHIVAAPSVLASVLQLSVLFFVDKLPSTSYAMSKWLHGGKLAELGMSSAACHRRALVDLHLQ